jgi:DNA-binding transcriptional regulator YiaG
VNVSKAEQTARRALLLQHVIAGHTYAQLRRDLGVSESTLARDLKVISSQLERWCAEQQNRALATAIAQYQRVIDEAWRAFYADEENERRWLAGEFAEQVQVPDPVDGARVERKTQQQFRSQKSDYLRVIVTATEKLCKLAGLERGDVVQQNNLVQLNVHVVYDEPLPVAIDGQQAR